MNLFGGLDYYVYFWWHNEVSSRGEPAIMGAKHFFKMGRIIVVFDAKTGKMDGFRDFRQAMEFLGLSRAKLKDIIEVGGAYHEERYVSELNIHKSNRGGKR